MMLAIEASETSTKIENKPQPNSLKKVFNKKHSHFIQNFLFFIKSYMFVAVILEFCFL